MQNVIVSIKDIAQRLGVAPSTVSRALNGMYGVNRVTRERIMEAAREMGYVANMSAKALVENKSHLVAIVLPTAGPSKRALLFELFPSMNQTLQLHSKDVVVTFIERTAYQRGGLEKLWRSRNLDGLIIMPGFGADHPIYQDAKTLDRPVVVFSEDVVGKTCSSIRTDDKAGLSLVVRHLIKLGHRRIGFINGPQGITICRSRFDGFKEGTQEAGFDLDDSLVIHSDFTGEGGGEAVKRLLQIHPELTAVVFSNDLMALGALRMLKQLNVSVPEHVSVTGYDDMFYSHLLTPSLTTVRHSDRLGTRAAELLVMLMSGEQGRIERLTPELVVRESTAPCEVDRRLAD